MNLSTVLLRKRQDDNKHPMLHQGLLALKKGEIHKATDLLLISAREGESNAFIILGQLLEDKKDESKVLNYYLRAYQMGNPLGYYYLGKYYLKKTDYPKAEEYLLDAYERGVIQSCVVLSDLEDRKSWDYIWYVVFGPLFLIRRHQYQESFWCFFLLLVITLISIKSITIPSFLITFFFLNLLFSNLYYKSIS